VGHNVVSRELDGSRGKGKGFIEKWSLQATTVGARNPLAAQEMIQPLLIG